MAMSRGKKFVIVGIVVVAAAAVLAPTLAHSLVKNKIDAKLQNEFGGIAHYESIALNWSPLGATMKQLTLGAVNPAAGNRPAIEIASVDVVLNSIFDSEPHFKSLTAHDFSVHIHVDERGESSLAKLIREKPLSSRTRPLTIDTLLIENIVISNYVAEKAPVPGNAASGGSAPDSILKVASVRAKGYVLPVPGQLLGRELWIPTEIETIEASGSPSNAEGQPASPALKIARITFELAQAANEQVPVRLKHFKAEHSDCIMAASSADRVTGFKHVVNSIQKGFGLQEPKELRESGPKGAAPHGTGLLIEDFQATNAMVETRGTDASGRAALWRLKDAQIDAANLAFGEQTEAPVPGTLKIESNTESSAVPGHFSLSVTDITGSYPLTSFKCSYHVENVAAAAFSSMSQSQGVKVRQGSLSVTFSGGASGGNLNLAGSVTLSGDFEIEGNSAKSIGVKLTRGKPIENVTIDGTLKHPQIHLPSELALLSDIIGVVLVSGPLGIVDSTIGEIPVIGSIVKETTKTGSKILGKIPGIGELFKKDEK